jgi:DNA-binding IclR family transcriptional regulator
MRNRSTNSSSVHVFRVLDLVVKSDEPLGVIEVARRCGLPNSTANRALTTLEQTGYIQRAQGSSKYHAGLQVHQLRHALFERFRIRQLCRPLLLHAVESFGRPAALFVRIGWYAAMITYVQGRSEDYHVRAIGELGVLGDSVPGRAILASQDDGSIREYFAFIQAHYPEYMIENARDDLWKDVGRIREREFSYSELDLHPRSVSLALPIRDQHSGIAALEIEGPIIPDPSLDKDTRILECREKIRSLEADIALSPELVSSPFLHLPPSQILLNPTA